jgi:hypothetical protein
MSGSRTVKGAVEPLFYETLFAGRVRHFERFTTRVQYPSHAIIFADQIQARRLRDQAWRSCSRVWFSLLSIMFAIEAKN